MAAKKPSNVLSITRIYDAPRSRVWDAWIEPDQVAAWWGPRGFTLTTHHKDVRTGGSWAYTMHGPDGTDYENKTLFLEVEPLKKLVYDHGGNDERKPLFRVSVLFSDFGDKTKMEMTMTLPTPEEAEKTRKFIKEAGGNSTWDRLAEYLARELEGREQFVINRTFDAPLDRLYSMWTDPEHFAKWLPPAGFSMEFLRAEIRVGATSFYRMTNGQGLTMYGTVEYLEFDAPNRIVYLQRFSDAEGRVSRHPHAPTWPEVMKTTVDLTAEGPDQTRVTVTWVPMEPLTKVELGTFVDGRAGMTGGWMGTFDKLDDYIEKTSR